MQQREENWEAKLDRELKSLPNRRAPATLLPRVLAKIEAQKKLPWYRRTWAQWPRSAQLFSGILTFAVFLAIGAGLNLAWDAFSWKTLVSGATTALGPIGSCLSSLSSACAVLFRKSNNLILILTVVLGLGMYLSCIGLGTVVYRVAHNR